MTDSNPDTVTAGAVTTPSCERSDNHTGIISALTSKEENALKAYDLLLEGDLAGALQLAITVIEQGIAAHDHEIAQWYQQDRDNPEEYSKNNVISFRIFWHERAKAEAVQTLKRLRHSENIILKDEKSAPKSC